MKQEESLDANNRIEYIAWSVNSSRLAVCTCNNNHILLLSGSSFEKKEKFALKPIDKSADRKSFAVKGIAFSSDSTKLAIAQSDCGIFVYKVGDSVGEKKTVAAKYSLPAPCTSLVWHETGIIFGSADGKIKLIATSTNRMSGIIGSNSMVISMSLSGNNLVAGFLAGAVVYTSIGSKESSRQLAFNETPPFALTLTSKGYCCFGGCDGKLTFIDVNNILDVKGRQVTEIGSEIRSATSSSSGNMIAITSGEKVIIMAYDNHYWKQNQVINLSGANLATCVSWSTDGTKLTVATVNGDLELFSFEWKSKIVSENFTIEYIGMNQVVITNTSSGSKAIFSSKHDIRNVKIVRSKFAVIWTTQTLIIGQLENFSTKKSEVEWIGMGHAGVKFCFDFESVAIIDVIGELYLIELGKDSFLTSLRTDYATPHLLSIRLNERKSGVKVFAYLLDIKTIAIIDLMTSIQICMWSHEDKIDWIELNETGKKLIFRDRSQRLNLLDIARQESQYILNHCGFVQWVPGSDVIVAQSREKIYVWYDLSKPTIYDAPSIGSGSSRIAEVTGIEREGGLTRITFGSTGSKNDIILDEGFLEFDTALNDGDLERALSFLETTSAKSNGKISESDAMWRRLASAALSKKNLTIAQRSFAALNDLTRVAYVDECSDDPVKLALLTGDYETFETGDFDTVIDTYSRLNKWQRAIDFAVRCNRYDIKSELEEKRLNWLMKTGQEAEAAAIKEAAGDLLGAINLYQKSGRIVKAANVILEANSSSKIRNEISQQLIGSLIDQLKSVELYEEAGLLYESNLLSDFDSALDCYVKGNAFTKAIDLARRHFPDSVVELEGKYGSYLFHQMRDPSSAVSHLIEAGKLDLALEASIQAGQFDRAAEIAVVIDKLNPTVGKQIADYFVQQDNFDQAVELYVQSNCIKDAIKLLVAKNQINKSLKLAKKFMAQDEVVDLFTDLASHSSNHKEAEKLYLAINDTDSAIEMYKSREKYDEMIRLVSQFHPELLADTHVHLARELENKGRYKEAEGHYIAIGDWKSVATMYRNVEKWEDAYSIARSYGGSSAAKQVAFWWAKSCSTVESSYKLLTRLGLLNQVTDFALELGEFDFATNLALQAGPEMRHKLNEINLKHALFLEDKGELELAESLFVQANRPKEAVLMYLHNHLFSKALQVAEASKDETSISEVFIAQAKYVLETGGFSPENFSKVESLLIRAGRVELAVRMYKEHRMWPEALRLCETHAPNLTESVKREMNDYRVGSESVRSSLGSRASTASKPSVALEDPFEDAGDVKKNLARAEKSNDRERIVKYSLMLAAQLIKERSPVDALSVVSSHPVTFLSPDCLRVITRIAHDIFELNQQPNIKVFRSLRDACLQVFNANPDSESNLSRLLLISHYFVIKLSLSNLKENSAHDLLVKLSTSLLRYTDIVRPDYAFYEAGQVCKENGKSDSAFVYWNHFLDLAEAIDDGNVNIEYTGLEETDIPTEVSLPQELFFKDPSVIDSVKSWILEISMESSSNHSLPSKDDGSYEASLVNRDGSHCLPCIVTGYPVLPMKMMELKSGQYAANKDDWNKLLMLTKVSASEDLKEVLLFIGKLCGNASVARFSFQ